MTIPTITGAELQARLKDQGVPLVHRAFKCPLCATVQSAFDFIKAGAAKDFNDANKHLGMACIGRFTGAGGPRKSPDGQPCDWIVGGFLQLHNLELVEEDGRRVPVFEPASPQEAQAHATSNDPRLVPGSYNLYSFLADAEATNITGQDLAKALATRPEFEDCVPSAKR